MRSLAIGVLAVSLALGLGAAPVAYADNEDFVRDVQAAGFYQESDNLVSQAKSACYFLFRGRGPDEIEARIARYSRVDPPSQSHLFLVLAVRSYCPQFADVVGP